MKSDKQIIKELKREVKELDKALFWASFSCRCRDDLSTVELYNYSKERGRKEVQAKYDEQKKYEAWGPQNDN